MIVIVTKIDDYIVAHNRRSCLAGGCCVNLRNTISDLNKTDHYNTNM